MKCFSVKVNDSLYLNVLNISKALISFNSITFFNTIYNSISFSISKFISLFLLFLSFKFSVITFLLLLGIKILFLLSFLFSKKLPSLYFFTKSLNIFIIILVPFLHFILLKYFFVLIKLKLWKRIFGLSQFFIYFNNSSFSSNDISEVNVVYPGRLSISPVKNLLLRMVYFECLFLEEFIIMLFLEI